MYVIYVHCGRAAVNASFMTASTLMDDKDLLIYMFATEVFMTLAPFSKRKLSDASSPWSPRWR